MRVWLFSLLSVGLVSSVSLIGVAALAASRARNEVFVTTLVSLAVGALLGDAFIHLIPEVFAGAGAATLGRSLLILAGVLLFFVVEKLLRHQHGPLHQRAHHSHHSPPGRPVLAALNLAGDAVHNAIDGALIGASYLTSPTLGLATTVAVILHEIPQELGDMGVLLHSGLTRRRAVLLNLGSASAAFLGAIAALLTGDVARSLVAEVFIPLAAGGFIYIAAADLIPELQHDRSLRALAVQACFISLGIAMMALLAVLG